MRSGGPKTNSDLELIPLTCFVDGRGSLTPLERAALPFDVARVYFVHGMEQSTTRGNHAHYRTNQVFLTVEGKVVIECYDGRERRKFALDTSESALCVPAGIWTTNHHGEGSVLCVLADRPYDERDYIEDRKIFKRWKRCQPFFGTFYAFTDCLTWLGHTGSLANTDWLEYQIEELLLDWSTDDADPELVNTIDAVGGPDKQPVVVVDFGGSLGHSYFKFWHSTLADNVKYHVVETSVMVDAGKKIFPKHGSLHFHRQIPNVNANIVYSRTSLQYVSDWRGVLERLAALGAEYMILSHTQAGKIETFVGVQNWYGHFVPNWFFNIDELLAAIPDYELLALTPGMAVNMTNYQPHQRLTHACNLTLKRRAS